MTPPGDWAVVEEALNLRLVVRGRPTGDAVMRDALAAVARLREREAQLTKNERDAWSKIARLTDALDALNEGQKVQEERAEAAEARVRELERGDRTIRDEWSHALTVVDELQHRAEAAEALSAERDLRVHRAEARVAELEEALREIADTEWGDESHEMNEPNEVARRALDAKKEEA